MNAKMKEACEAVADVFEGNPDAWTTEFFAKADDDTYATVNEPAASKWCAVGGVMAALKTDDCELVFGALNPIATNLGYDCAGHANNKGGRKVAIRMLRLAAQS